MHYTKDNQVFTLGEIKKAHKNICFGPNTLADLGYSVHVPVANPETPEQAKVRLARLVSNLLNAKANEYRYDSIHTAINAKDSHVVKFANEGTAFLQYWSNVWAFMDQLELDVVNNVRTIPTDEQLISELPVFVAP